mmetsp:Transcript_9616/g.18862  ORF Transcript_9616/g.18862 Transcript_9616/m.18862 type:complete len:125 (-) Transcript_9616:78-452(-)
MKARPRAAFLFLVLTVGAVRGAETNRMHEKGGFQSILGQGMDLLPDIWKQKLRQAQKSAAEDPIGFATTVSDALSYLRKVTGDASGVESGKKVFEGLFRQEEEKEEKEEEDAKAAEEEEEEEDR